VNEASNKKAAEAIFDAFARGAIDEILARLTDDAKFVSYLDPVVPWSGEFQGKGQVLQYFQALGGSVEVSDHPVEHVLAQGDDVRGQGDVVSGQGIVSFTVRETGRRGSSTGVYVFTFADDKVRSFEQYIDQGLAEDYREH